MKTLREYITESKRTYDFRVKLANCELDSDVLERIERALSAYQLADITAPKSMPITKYKEFVALGPVSCSQFTASTNYPVISNQVRQAIHAHTHIPLQQIYVSTALEDDMEEDPTSEKEQSPILTQPEMKSASAQDSVGEKRIGSLLAELEKDKHGGEQYKGVNDDILAKSAHADPKAKTTLDFPMNTVSPVGSIKNKLQGPRGK